MSLCMACRGGAHHHDRYPNGDGAECPNLAADPETPGEGCTCAARLPREATPHRCLCGNVHIYGAGS